MIRKRSARIVPGAKPLPSSEGEEARLSDAPRRIAASTSEGVARRVGSCDKDPAGAPQAGQKRLASGSSAEHEEQRIDQPETRVMLLHVWKVLARRLLAIRLRRRNSC